MARNVKFDDLKKFKDKVEQSLGSDAVDAFIQSCAKELAARLLAKVIKRTPVGQYKDGKVGGTLRRGWITKSEKEAELSAVFSGSESVTKKYINSLDITKNGNVYIITIVNPVHYASYVEFGHRTRGGDGWVEGKFMLTISEMEVQGAASKILENKLKKKLGECFK